MGTKELAEILRVSVDIARDIKFGRRPVNVAQLGRLAEALDIDVREFFEAA
ncbi:helix-turn-helix transcriptional regulator [Diaminobutyricibacter tongyongensis]|uniref:Helix-turn-helix transcriptional regulator n=1 Tax=Leifsonia tongyongensis TaxID=1268043 RepID=A0A6L9XY28_9MICO|nr:helix-turn-helix transcriptional regulator [Diaminobutyricibacter tongyongensis]NEN06331.1 helix-turn-helix transcriptional regulator [Diaminobutyricibacter tongyongensis]